MDRYVALDDTPLAWALTPPNTDTDTAPVIQRSVHGAPSAPSRSMRAAKRIARAGTRARRLCSPGGCDTRRLRACTANTRRMHACSGLSRLGGGETAAASAQYYDAGVSLYCAGAIRADSPFPCASEGHRAMEKS